ncbi:MAG: sigma-70 family RNA polymerase sigma factor [Planctomycetota bacterium]
MSDTRPTFDDLLAHEPFVTTLARTLVPDENRAADVTQDVWATALRNPPERTGNLRGWLAAVTRNAARMLYRSEGRRQDRESATTPSTCAPSAADVAARIELRRKLVDSVESLPDPYRTVVVLRYFDGLRPVDIAERLGVPAKTVHTRLRRALARLRADLDPGGRRRGPAALLTLIGALIMSTKAKAAAVTVVALLVSFAAWRVSSGVGDRGGPPRTTPSPAPEVVPIEEPQAAVDVAVAAGPEREETPGPALPVLVLGPGDRPLPKVKVVFVPTHDEDAISLGVTGVDGRTVLKAVGTGELRVIPPADHAPRRIAVVAGGEELEIRLTRGPSIRGRFIDRHGEPLADCLVRARAEPTVSWLGRSWRRSCRTDENGSFEIFGLLEGRYGLLPGAPPAAGSSPDPTVEANAGDTGVVLRLGSLRAPVIRVLDRETGVPVVGPRTVFLLQESSEQHLVGRTGPGDLGMHLMPPDGTRLKIVADGYREGIIDPPREDGDLLVEVRLERDPEWQTRPRLDLHVVDDRGHPLAEVRVRWRTPAPGQTDVRLENGRGSVQLPSGDHELTVSGRWTHATEKIEITLSRGETATRKVVLVRLGHVEIHAVRGDSINVLHPDGSRVLFSVNQISEGLRLNLRPGKYVLRVTRKGGKPVDRDITIESGRTVEVSRE